ncbi:hypothetical protein JW872_01740 [Candidatus Babeliales bacterium]|nr:hypothetical protein [Candidatus Babeliales bacterium]
MVSESVFKILDVLFPGETVIYLQMLLVPKALFKVGTKVCITHERALPTWRVAPLSISVTSIPLYTAVTHFVLHGICTMRGS